MPSHRRSRAGVAIHSWVTKWIALVVVVVACKPVAGGKCDDPVKIVCTSAEDALVCANKHWTAKECVGGCAKRTDPQGGEGVMVCADSITPKLGDPCYLEPTLKMPTEESACAPDGTAVIACRASEGHAGGGFWEVAKPCAPGTKCQPERAIACVSTR